MGGQLTDVGGSSCAKRARGEWSVSGGLGDCRRVFARAQERVPTTGLTHLPIDDVLKSNGVPHRAILETGVRASDVRLVSRIMERFLG